ncbi:MAG: hypothetical protein COS14_11010, partial [Bacteroidetes bacterium CG02_land_8_20_14_3_00_31_25]
KQMKLFSISLLFGFFVITNAKAGDEHFPIGARQAGMGSSGVAFPDLWSVTHNPAGLTLLTKPTFGLFYENRFALKELGLKAGAFAYPTSSGVFAIDLMQFGYSKYNESRVGLAFAKSIGKRFSLGIKFDYLNTYFAEEYGNKGTAIAEIGFLAQPANHFYIGGHVYNLSRSKIAEYNDERVPTIITFGIAYEFSEKVLSTIEVEKDIEYKPIYKVGVEYKFMENLFIRAGVTSNPNQMSLGIGYAFKRIKADISFSSHQILGISPHIGFSYEFGNTTSKKLAN